MAEVGLSRGILLVDSGGISAIAEGDQAARAALARARREGRTVVIPTAVLAETITGRRSHAGIDIVIGGVDSEIPLTSERARQAGILRSKAIALREGRPTRSRKAPPSAVDAVVMAEAMAAGAAVILTSDPDDMELLREAAGLTDAEVAIVVV